ncbi:MAG: CRISPR-associated helicase Cas3' [Candidatus Helarchaeota archaeon]|nr:CRISPR-associated helicase Cas3' [Candidatus Helarchaeota archaeon]
MNLLQYIWGKARKRVHNDETIIDFHPLICHLIDTAAVAEALWDQVFTRNLKLYLSQSLFQNGTKTKNWLIFLAGIHDIGKATPVFQSRVPELACVLSDLGLNSFSSDKYHSILSGMVLFRYLLSIDLKAAIDGNLDPLKYVIGGHHGIFPRAENFNELIPEHLGLGKWKEIQKELIEIVRDFCDVDFDLFNIIPFNNNLNLDKQKALLIFIAGFISVVDWIASCDSFFNFYSGLKTKTDIRDKYYSISRKRAKNALKTIGWSGWKSASISIEIRTFHVVFPLIKHLRPLQEVIVDNLDHIFSPSLIMIEAPMGEGKTEAAFYIEHYLEANEGLQGAYIALPTQATANQMFLRVKDFLTAIKQGLRVNLHLLHGNAIISDEYSLLKTRSQNYDGEESPVVADSWFTYRKRGLISPFGVGTIDQILLSVLPLRHFFVRLFGLAGKVIIIDEIHSYDVYMSTILEYLLYWLRLLGSSVILLSATLPSFKRKKLIKTYQPNINDEIINKPYPRITICSGKGVKVYNFETTLKKQENNSVLIEWIDEHSIPTMVSSALKNGGRVAIICNKVRRAQKLFLRLKGLKNEGFEVDLLHSRFPFYQRNKIENLVIEKYGKDKNHIKFRRILISTQIIEQSLDLDFDLMISDLAPIDLLFQRMGRLHRHVQDQDGNPVIRSKNLKRPQFWVINPSINEYKIPTFSYPIYSKFVLLKTYFYLKPLNSVNIPDDIEGLIEQVYNNTLNIPKEFEKEKDQWDVELQKAKEKQDNLEADNRLMAKYRLIPNPSDEDFFEDITSYLEENTKEAQASLQSLTRITIPSLFLVGLYQDSDGLYLDEELNQPISIKGPLTRAEEINVLNHAIKVSNRSIYHLFINKTDSIPRSWVKSTLLNDMHYVILTRDPDSGEYYFETDRNMNYFNKELGLYIQNKR